MKKYGGALKGYCVAVLFIVLGLFLFTASAVTLQAKTKKVYEDMEITTKQLTFSKIKFAWPKKKNVTKVVIYGGERLSSGMINYDHKVKTLSAKKTSVAFKLKKGKKYGWRVEAVCKASKNKQVIWCGELYTVTAVSETMFDDYQYFEGKVTPKSIQLTFYTGSEIKPDIVELSRRPVSGGSFKVIKTYKCKKAYQQFVYTDKDVKTGKGYEYRVRAYKKDGKKKIYGDADKVVMYAVNQSAKLSVNEIAKEADTQTIEVKSDKKNGKIVVKYADLASASWTDREEQVKCAVTEVSADGTVWNAVSSDSTEKLTLSPGKKILMKISMTKIEAEQPSTEEDADEEEYYDDEDPGRLEVGASYHGQEYATYLAIDPKGGSGSTFQNPEMIH